MLSKSVSLQHYFKQITPNMLNMRVLSVPNGSRNEKGLSAYTVSAIFSL